MTEIKFAQQYNCIGLIPAAGKGSRLGLPFPKELFPIIDNQIYKPIAQYSVEYLLNAHLRHIVMVINESKHALIGYLGSGKKFDCNISYVVQESWETDFAAKSPGLAHALDSAFHLTKGKIVFFSMPDTIFSPSDVFLRAKNNAPIDTDVLLCLFPTTHPEKYGMVEFNQNKRALRIFDKPEKTNLTHMWGCIIWNPIFTEFLHRSVSIEGQGDFAIILNNAILSGLNANVYVTSNSEFIDIGTPNEIEEVHQHFYNLKT